MTPSKDDNSQLYPKNYKALCARIRQWCIKFINRFYAIVVSLPNWLEFVLQERKELNGHFFNITDQKGFKGTNVSKSMQWKYI